MNITLGSRYLSQLNARFKEPLLAVAAYNAGPHRVQRWVAERPQADLEEFVDQIPFDETRAVFSPDGRRVAYVSEESGRPEISVCGFPDCSNRRQISTGGGIRPRWRADGRELFYVARGGKLMVVDVGSNGEFGTPKELFQVRGAGDYAVARDGQRFLVAVGLEDPTTAPATVVLNWTADLKKR